MESISEKPGKMRVIHKHLKTKKRRNFSSAQIIIFGFLALILLGALLLMLPVSSRERSFTDLETALFTSFSATCVTGLTVVDTASYWSLFGQLVIMMLMQIGGLGFMTLAVMLSIFTKRKISPKERLITAQSLGLIGVGGTVRLVKRIIFGTFIIEGIGAVIFSSQFIPHFGVLKGIYHGIFHSISAFCNAGYDIIGLTDYKSNYFVSVTLIVLIIIGGIGFIVWDDIANFIQKRQRFSIYSKFVLIITALLILSGAVLIGFYEWNNPETIGNMSISDKIFQCLFQSVTLRTTGIDFIGNAFLTPSSQIISIFLMFIGGASGSTAGGIKVATFGVMLVAFYSYTVGKTEIAIWKRRIRDDMVIRAATIFSINLTAGLISAMFISAYENVSLISAFYEAFSAISTAGISLSLTPQLSFLSHIILMMLMFFGRIGILTITYSIMLNQAKKESCISYSEVNFLIG
jgi:trk system potassium uptake protein TrkH